MTTTNTGYKGYSKLLKVTNDGTNRPLDDNNMLCSETGLPQSIKDNIISDPDYFAPIQDLISCPTNTPPPTPVNCVVSEWSAWSDCVDGSQTRTRTIITPSSNGGTSCPVLTETQQCEVITTCVNYTVSTSSATSQSYEYRDCSGTLITGANIGGAGGYDADTFCAESNSVVLIGNDLFLTDNGLCEDVTIISVTSVNSYIDQCGAGNDSTILTTSINLSSPVSVDTLFSITTAYSLSGDCNNSINTDTQITVVAGDSSGQSANCLSGGSQIEYYATICNTYAWQHDNTVDVIML